MNGIGGIVSKKNWKTSKHASFKGTWEKASSVSREGGTLEEEGGFLLTANPFGEGGFKPSPAKENSTSHEGRGTVRRKKTKSLGRGGRAMMFFGPRKELSFIKKKKLGDVGL